MDDLERMDIIGRRAASVLDASVRSRIDIDDAWLAAQQHQAGTVALDDRRPPRLLWARRAVRLGAAAAVVGLVIAGVVWSRSGTTTRIAPSDTVDTTVEPVVETTVALPSTTDDDPSTSVTTPASASPMPPTTLADQIPTSPTNASVPATTVAPDPSTDLLAAWPSPPARPAGQLADLPMLLPSAPVPGATSAVRRESVGGLATIVDHIQVWVEPGAAGRELTIETNPGQGTAQGGESVMVAPWDQAVFPMTSQGITHLVLADPSGYVSLVGRGLDRDELLSVATSLSGRADGAPGWEVATLPTGLVAVHEGWSTGGAGRGVRWSGAGRTIAELDVMHGSPSIFSSPGIEPGSIGFIEVGGVRAVTFDEGFRSTVVWSPAPDVTVRFGLYGPIDDAIAVARSMSAVDLATWESTLPLEPAGNDGCQSMYC